MDAQYGSLILDIISIISYFFTRKAAFGPWPRGWRLWGRLNKGQTLERAKSLQHSAVLMVC